MAPGQLSSGRKPGKEESNQPAGSVAALDSARGQHRLGAKKTGKKIHVVEAPDSLLQSEQNGKIRRGETLPSQRTEGKKGPWTKQKEKPDGCVAIGKYR